MNKKVVFAFIAGWLVAWLLGPRDVAKAIRPRAA